MYVHIKFLVILCSYPFLCLSKILTNLFFNMRKAFTLLLMAVFTAGGAMSQTVTKVATFDFQKPETIKPAGYAPDVPENADDRSSMYEVNINGVEFVSDGVTLCASGGLHNEDQVPPSNYTWRRGYDDLYNKRPTESSKEGTYYLNLRMSNTEDEIAADPSQMHYLTVTAPEGATIKEVVIHGLSSANAAQYLQLVDPESGTYTSDSQTRLNTFTPAEGRALRTVQFTCPRKRADGVNLSGYLVANVSVTIEVPDVAEPEPEGLPLPYNRVFKNLDDMTVIDGNNDGYTWDYNLSTARCTAPLGDDNPSTEADDWLITPGLAMYGNKYYKVYTPLVAQYGSPAKIEVKIGSSTHAEDMTIPVMQPLEFESRRDCINYVKIPSNGTYYVGVHSLTPKNGALYVKLSEIDVYEPMEPTVPGPVTDLKVSPASDGIKPYKVTLTFKAPAVDLDGNPLTENLEKVVIGNGTYPGNALSSVSHTFTDVVPGEELTYVYSQNGLGYRTFGIVAYNASGIGAETYTESTYVGVNKPDDPTDLTITETEKTGEVVLSWKAPENDVDGNPINPDLIKYTLTDCLSYETIVRDLSGTSYTYNTGLTNDQKFFKFAIVAETAGGKTMSVISPYVAVGKPLETPLSEGFERVGVMPINLSGNDGVASIFHDADMSGAHKPYSAEGDEHYVALYGYSSAAHPSLLTAKISLEGLTSPAVAFNVFAPVAANESRIFNNNEVVVKARTPQGEYTELGTVKLGDLPSAGWNRVVYPLSDFAGKDVQLLFESNLVDYPNGEGSQSFAFIDRLQVRDTPQGTDAAVLNMVTPVVAEQSYPFSITAYVENDGNTAVSDAVAELYRNGDKVDTADLSTLSPGQIEIVKFTQTLGAVDGSEVSYKVVVASDEDEKEDNNESEEKDVNYKTSIHPRPESLAGTADATSVTLTWDAPTLPGGTAQSVTETFEIEDRMAVDEYGGWTFVDLDKGTLGLPTGMTIEGLEEGKTQYAWIVADESLFNAQGMAHSGTHFLTGFFNYDGRTNNDVAISPELNGDAQTLSFYAMSFSSKYPETIDVWYSTETRDVNDFKPLRVIENVASGWTEYTVELPEDTRFFAIRHVSSDAWIVGVDDVTFKPMEPGKDVELLGYNVYRDGEKLNKRPVAEPTYCDESVEDGKHSYHVSAVYDKGESLASDPVELEYSSVGVIMSGSSSVRGGAGYISVTLSEASEVDVYSASGVKVFSGQCEDGMTKIDVASGVYVVNVNGHAAKVIVK